MIIYLADNEQQRGKNLRAGPFQIVPQIQNDLPPRFRISPNTQIAGRKALMLDPDVRTPINLVIERKILSEHGVPDEGGILPF